MKGISRSFSPFFLATILLVGVGCSKKPNDAQVSTDVQNKFSQDSGLSDKQLTVQASNGVVTLVGTVDNDAQREAAARQAASISGVREVVTGRIHRLCGAPSTEDRAAQEISSHSPHTGSGNRQQQGSHDGR